VYVFVRQDIPIQHQMVQSNHAVLTVSSAVAIDGIPNIILIGVPDVPALNRAKAKLIAHGIDHSEWVEPDMDLGFTAMATVPLSVEEKIPLAHYRLWRPMIPSSLDTRASCQPVREGREAEVRVLPREPKLDPVTQ
jgi:hypothetical protein